MKQLRWSLAAVAWAFTIISVPSAPGDVRAWGGWLGFSDGGVGAWLPSVLMLVAALILTALACWPWINRQLTREESPMEPSDSAAPSQPVAPTPAPRVAMEAHGDSTIIVGNLKVRNHDQAALTHDRAVISADDADIG